MSEFTVNGREYRTTKLNAFKQFHIARRILPLIAKLPEMMGMTLNQCLTDADALKNVATKNMNAIRLDVIAEALSELKNEDVDYVMSTCCDAVKVKQDTGWTWVRFKGQMMINFVGMQELMSFAVHVIKDNLSDFFSESTPTSADAQATVSA